MSDRGVIFSAPMVRALLSGLKTQTRRILKPQPEQFAINDAGGLCDIGLLHVEGDPWPRVTTGLVISLQEVWFAIGQQLWVRETWKPHSTFAGVRPRDIPPSNVFYAADKAYAPSNTPWRSPIHMPRWASRLTLTVTDVRVQRLQEISEEDAIAEGVRPAPGGWWSGAEGQAAPTARASYALLWNSIHGPGAWDLNPWVAAVSFAAEHRNIDSPPVPRMEDAA